VVGGLLVVALCLLAAGLLRTPAGYALGSTVQILVVAGGFIVPAMFFLGGLFALLWVSAILVARRAARVVAARAGSNGHGSPAGQGDQPAPG